MNPIALILSLFLVAVAGTASAQADPLPAQLTQDLARTLRSGSIDSWDTARSVWKTKSQTEWKSSPDGALQAVSAWNEDARAWEIRVWDNQARELAVTFTNRWDFKKWLDQRDSLSPELGAANQVWKAWVESASKGEEATWNETTKADWSKSWSWE